MDLSNDTADERPLLSNPITVLGNERLVVSGEALAAFPTESRTATIACASGARHVATWRGIPVMELLGDADVPDETTHLVVESDDGYRICVDIVTALDGLLAFVRDGRPISVQNPYETRFVAPDVDGARTVKGVSVFEARQLSTETDPETLEVLSGTDEYSA